MQLAKSSLILPALLMFLMFTPEAVLAKSKYSLNFISANQQAATTPPKDARWLFNSTSDSGLVVPAKKIGSRNAYTVTFDKVDSVVAWTDIPYHFVKDNMSIDKYLSLLNDELVAKKIPNATLGLHVKMPDGTTKNILAIVKITSIERVSNSNRLRYSVVALTDNLPKRASDVKDMWMVLDDISMSMGER